MPLVRFDILEGKSEAFVAILLDAAHRAIVRAFELAGHDRQQIVYEHPREHIFLEDSGLGIERSDDVVLISVTSRPRPETVRMRFYEELCIELQSSCGISPSDIVVVITPDWSPVVPGHTF